VQAHVGVGADGDPFQQQEQRAEYDGSTNCGRNAVNSKMALGLLEPSLISPGLAVAFPYSGRSRSGSYTARCMNCRLMAIVMSKTRPKTND
jgi:hypothetical protein